MIILLTGQPGVGKSTIVQTVMDSQVMPIVGTVGREITTDNSGQRLGFAAVTMDDRSRTFAHTQQFQDSPHKIAEFFVDVAAFDEFCVPELQKGLGDKNALVIIDEIGRMQSFSDVYMETVRKLFHNNGPLLGTIVFDDEPWGREFKQHPEVVLLTVTQGNREQLTDLCVTIFSHYTAITQLTDKQQQWVQDRLKFYVEQNQWVQANKLFENAVEYVAQKRIQKQMDSETDMQFVIQGNTNYHKTIFYKKIQQFECDCDVFHGRGQFVHDKGDCSHIMAAQLFLLTEE